jgi:hypothetical protein
VVGWDDIKREEDRGGATDLLALLAMDIIMKEEGLFPVAGRPCNIQHSYLLQIIDWISDNALCKLLRRKEGQITFLSSIPFTRGCPSH